MVRRPRGITVPAGAALAMTQKILLEDFPLGLMLAEAWRYSEKDGVPRLGDR